MGSVTETENKFLNSLVQDSIIYNLSIQESLEYIKEFEGKKTKRVHYTVTDPKLPMEGEKVLPMSLTNAISINALLKKGLNLLEVKRIGADRNTKYTFAPV